MTDLNEMTTALVSCDKDKLVELVNSALADNIPAGDILNQGLIAGMDVLDPAVLAQVVHHECFAANADNHSAGVIRQQDLTVGQLHRLWLGNGGEG